MKSLVIYGAEISGLCAAYKFKSNCTENANITIISPNASKRAGGIAITGALNCWDVKWYKYNPESTGSLRSSMDNLCQQGTFRYLYDHNEAFTSEHTDFYRGQWYKVDTDAELSTTVPNSDEDFGEYLTSDLVDHLGIDFIPKMDIWDIESHTENEKIVIDKLFLRSIYRDDEGYIKWGRKTKCISGDWFVDASEDGKLTSFLTEVTTGRYDWPTECTPHENNNSETFTVLEQCEQNSFHIARQQSATLYFRIQDIAYYRLPNRDNANVAPWAHDTETENIKDSSNDTYKYNLSHYDSPHMIKLYNMGRNSTNTDENEFWANMLLLFNVDGRANYRDRISKFYPEAMLSDNEEKDDAWIRGNEIINEKALDENNNEYYVFDKGIKAFSGIGDGASIVRDDNGRAIVADQLYIRETVHLPLNSNQIGNNSENNYAVGKMDVITENQLPNTSSYNEESKKTRIGLGYYGLDVHSYTKASSIRKNGNELSFADDVYKWTRPDIWIDSTGNGNINNSPIYIPYEAIYSSKFKNMLVAGNASCISSLAWAELRVLPNLCVLGDAAGIILSYIVNNSAEHNQITLDSIQSNIIDLNGQLSCIHEYMESANIRLKRYLNNW